MGLLTPTVVKTSWSLLTSLELTVSISFSLSLAETCVLFGDPR